MKIGNHARANNLVVSSFLFLNMEAYKINGRDYGFFGLERAFTAIKLSQSRHLMIA